MDKKFTAEQKNAIETKNSNLLIAAAAGSGKTAVLVERIIKKITNENEPVNIDRLLIVTFTEASASEMRRRISKALYDKLEEEYDSEYLKKQVALLSKASICTIHSFCMGVIKKNFHLIDLDCNFKVADMEEMSLLKGEVLEEIFEEEYSLENNELFFSLVESYGGGKTKDNSLQNLVLEMHGFISSLARPHSWLKKHIETYNVGEVELDDIIYVKLLKEDIKLKLDGILESIDMALLMCHLPDGPEKYADALEHDRDIVNSILEGIENKSFYEIENSFVSVEHKKIYTYKAKDGISIDIKEKVKKIRDDNIKGELKKIKEKIFFKPVNLMFKDFTNMYPVLKKLCDLVILFGEKYKLAKLDKNKVDFNDLEQYCLQILVDENSTEDNPIPSKVALELREYYAEVLIDEFQDSNSVQELILSSISKDNPKNRFMVGDMKQSIYKFRGANPNIFINKYKEYESFKSLEGHDYKIDLSKNFRSRKCILDAVNFLFYQIMTAEVGGIEYDEKCALYYAGTFEETAELVSDSVELHIAENIKHDEEGIIEELSNIELEAKVISKRINEIVNIEKLNIWDESSKGYRKAEYRDIVIITRSLANSCSVLLEELKNYDIPAFANVQGGYFETLEVQLIVSYLQIIDNPLQDVHVITVLSSPIYMISSDELIEIRNMNKDTEFYNCIEQYLESNSCVKLERFKSDLEKFRKLAVHLKISDLLNTIYEETDYYNYLSTMPASNVRQANLLFLKEKAVQYEKSSYKGLFHFILYITKLKTISSNEGNAKLNSENENVVKIMTIHKSKGLEFPIVFVSLLGKKFNAVDSKKSLIMHPELGIGTNFIDVKNRIKTNTLSRLALASKLNEENLSEELRVLYVALTRAKEKLILTGCVSKFLEQKDKWSYYINRSERKLPSHFIRSCNNYIDLICTALARHKEGYNIRSEDSNLRNEELYNYDVRFEVYVEYLKEFINEQELKEEKFQVAYEKLQNIKNGSNYSGKEEEIIKKFTWVYEYEKEKNLPTKISITELKKLYQKEKYDEGVELLESKTEYKRPVFLEDEKTRMSNAKRGTIIHTVMENLDVNVHISEEKIIILLKELVLKGIVTESEVNEVPIKKIFNFVKSNIADRMRNSKIVKKETPFVMGLNPYEVYKIEDLKKSTATIFVHGIVDLYFEEEDEIVLLDYKSDRFISNEKLVERYGIQLNIYKKALEKSIEKKVKECLIYSFDKEDIIKVEIV